MAVDAAGALYVADDIDNRVLRYSPPFATGMSADLALGQADFVSGGAASPPTAASLNVPYGVAVDSTGAVFVADFSNGRVLRYRAPFSTGMSADMVLGQAGFGAPVTSPVSAALLIGPAGLAFDPAARCGPSTPKPTASCAIPRRCRPARPRTWCWAAGFRVERGAVHGERQGHGVPSGHRLGRRRRRVDRRHARQPRARVRAAVLERHGGVLVLGQPDLVSNDNGFGVHGLNGPSGLFVDSANVLWVADNASSRVLKFNGPDVSNRIGTSSSQTVKLEGAVNTFSLDVPEGRSSRT